MTFLQSYFHSFLFFFFLFLFLSPSQPQSINCQHWSCFLEEFYSSVPIDVSFVSISNCSSSIKMRVFFQLASLVASASLSTAIPGLNVKGCNHDNVLRAFLAPYNIHSPSEISSTDYLQKSIYGSDTVLLSLCRSTTRCWSSHLDREYNTNISDFGGYLRHKN